MLYTELNLLSSQSYVWCMKSRVIQVIIHNLKCQFECIEVWSFKSVCLQITESFRLKKTSDH